MFLLDAQPPTTWLDYLQSGGVVALLVIGMWTMLTRRIVPGWVYDSMVEERNYYRELAHKGTDLADRQMTIAEELYSKIHSLEDNRRGDLQREERRYGPRPGPE